MPDALQETLFPNDGEHTYAIIDGASCEDMLEKLDEFAPRHYCLYAGEIEPDVEEVAPHVVELLPGHPCTEWLLAQSPGKHWGIFARSSAGLRAVRKHFRTFLLVKSPQGKSWYFRYYDPRVLRMYLPTCNAQEITHLFGPVSTYLTETDEGSVTCWRHAGGALASRQIPLENRPVVA